MTVMCDLSWSTSSVSPDAETNFKRNINMANQHYSLRWNNHQNHILNAFDNLLQNETLVDVTLVCEETSVRAHKVVLCACSPYFQRIFSENPCKHPIIVLKDLHGWEVQAIVDFMYKGEISVVQEQLQSIIKAAESLQVRGLTQTEPSVGEKEAFCSSPGISLYPGRPFSTPTEKEPLSLSPYSPLPAGGFDSPLKMNALPHMPHITFTENPPHPDNRSRNSDDKDKDRGSPIPRRKQARPMRRSGELTGGPQDLSMSSTGSPGSETAENLSMKKIRLCNSSNNSAATSNSSSVGNERRPSSHPSTPQSPPQLSMVNPKHESQSEPDTDRERDDREMPHITDDYPPSRQEPHHIPPPPQPPDATHDNPSFLPIPSLSALSMTPPHVFSLDQQLGLFPGIENCRNPLLNELPDHRNDNHIMHKRKMGRPKGQHSAPRGGPPRSWTNAELTEALQHVWNKKMTTSQASRIFGIPYNSLLMYVRGKYGKSLKLEQLKKDCLGGPGGPMDLLNMSANASNNNNHPVGKPPPDEITHPPRPDHDLPLPPGFNPYTAANFYPDFGSPFPVPVSMIHLLPQNEKNRELYAQSEKARELLNQTEKAREFFSQSEKARELFNQSEKAREMFHHSEKARDLYGPSEKGREFFSQSEKARELFSHSEKARELFSQSEKARELFSQSEKARELFNQAMQLPQDLSSPDSKEDECRSIRCRSRDNNNSSSLEGSPNIVKMEPHPQLIENGEEN